MLILGPRMGSIHRSNNLGLFLYGVDGAKLSCVLPDEVFDVGYSIPFGIEDFLSEVINPAGREELENRDAAMVKGLNVCF